jgi:hypothetical protein
MKNQRGYTEMLLDEFYELAVTPDANDTYLAYSVIGTSYSSIEVLLNGIAEDEEAAHLTKIMYDVLVRGIPTTNTSRLVAYLIMLVSDGDASALASHTDDTQDDSFELTTALDAAVTGNYRYNVLGRSVLVPKYYGNSIYDCHARFRGNYVVPRRSRNKGLFVSDEALDEQNFRSQLCVVVLGEVGSIPFQIASDIRWSIDIKTVSNVLEEP